MKRTILSLALIVLFSATGTAQNAKLDNSGNYVAISTRDTSKAPLKSTGKSFTDSKGKVFTVYISKNGKLFTVRTSKAGNVYHSYLKL